MKRVILESLQHNFSISPVRKGEGPGAPSAGFEIIIETGATCQEHPFRPTRRALAFITSEVDPRNQRNKYRVEQESFGQIPL